MAMQTHTATAPDETFARRKTSIPSWVISVVLHLLGVVVLALLLRGVPARGLHQEPERAVSLVLAQTSSNAATAYVDQDQAAEQATETAAVQAADPLPQEAPAQSPALALPDLALPGPSPVVGDVGDLVQQPTLGGGTRRTRFPNPQADAIAAADAARLKQRSAGGSPTQVSIFGSAPASGRSFVFVLDRSDSMGGDGLNALAAAEIELKKAIRALQPHHRFQIIAYHHKNEYYQGKELVTAVPAHLGRLDNFLGGLSAYGATLHDVGLFAALRLQPDVIFLLTDGGDPWLNEADIRRIRQRAGGVTTVHCVQFGFGARQSRDGFMEQLAAETGGSYKYVNMSQRR